MSHVAELIEHFIDLINEDSQCVGNIEYAGEMLQYLDRSLDKPRVRLSKQDGETFTLNNSYDIQIGSIPQTMEVIDGARSEYGGVYQNVGLSYRYDLILFVSNPRIKIELERLVNAFSSINNCYLLNAELNPVQVVLRYGLVSPEDIGSYPPDLRAFAFSYNIQTFTTKF